MSPHEPADLDWLAFQYVNDDLPPQQAERFEERLAVDQAAREAVAAAMLLLQTVAAGAQIVSPAPRQRSWLHKAGWAAIGAAACLAIVFIPQLAPQQEAVVQGPQATDMTSAELALVWAQNNAFAMTVTDSLEDDLGLAADSRDDREVVVPAWMLEALSGSEEAKPPVKESQES
jgi:hypothetical protein